jgi:hypothetical protein
MGDSHFLTVVPSLHACDFIAAAIMCMSGKENLSAACYYLGKKAGVGRVGCGGAWGSSGHGEAKRHVPSTLAAEPKHSKLRAMKCSDRSMRHQL